jgi:hypothetical protein
MFLNHNTEDKVFQNIDNSMISFQAYSYIIFMFSCPRGDSIQSKISHYVNSKSLAFGDDIDNESTEKEKIVIISLIRSYVPNDWSLALVGASSHVFNIMKALPIKISKNYVVDPSNE